MYNIFFLNSHNTLVKKIICDLFPQKPTCKRLALKKEKINDWLCEVQS